MERAPCLRRISSVYCGNRFTSAGDIAMPVRIGGGSHNDNGGKVSKLLQGIVPIETVGLRRKVEVGVKNEGVPGLYEDAWRSGHKPLPLRAGQKPMTKKIPVSTKP